MDASAAAAFESSVGPAATTPQNTGAALVALGLGSFALGTTEFLPVALLPTIAGDLEVSLPAAGLLVSGYAMGVTLLTPILSALFSGLPRKGMLISLMALFFVTNMACAFAPSYGFLLGVRFFTAISHGVFLAAATNVAAKLVGRGKEAHAIGVVFAGLSIAMATIVPLGSLLGQTLGWRIAFAGTAFLGLIATIAQARYLPKLPAPTKRMTLAAQAAVMKQPRVLLALGMTAIGYAGTFATFTYMTAILEEISGFHAVAVTLILGVIGLCITFGNIIGGKAADRKIYPALMGLFCLVVVGMIGLWLAAPFKIAMIVAVIFFGIFMFSPGAGLQLLAVNQARRWTPGAVDVAAGLNQSAFNLGIALGAVIGGQVVASPLGLGATPLVSAGVVVLAIGLIAIGWRMDRNVDPQPEEVAVEPESVRVIVEPAASAG
ncbi:MFS transporter [Blastopirellula sp. JC732]|uniref:MFS transporter n=1 Tax=Blastopirellula sediminis TaxID=2894196 RepID=A0A9X1MLN7_9BACT|nr:MFS transporter [Blastopirellula sediminis]MCC9607379.1 MFS transporter [Blastopirellula sediminis]MCC9629328.1 MFS transporter [Blastopirellula sediminis]